MTVLFIVGILLYDTYAYITGGQGATISHLIITNWSREYPFFTFMCGVAMGHLFWPLYRKY